MEREHQYADELLSDRELLRRRLADAAVRLVAANNEYLALIEESIALNAEARGGRLE